MLVVQTGWKRLWEKKRQSGKHLLHCDSASAAVCKQILHPKIQLKKYLWSVKEKRQRYQHHSFSVPNYHTSLLAKWLPDWERLQSAAASPCGAHTPPEMSSSSQVHSHMQVSATAWRLPTESMLLRWVSTKIRWVAAPHKIFWQICHDLSGNFPDGDKQKRFQMCLCLLMSCAHKEEIGLPHHLQLFAKYRVCGCFQQSQKAQLCFV